MDFSLCLQYCRLSRPLFLVPSTVKFSRSDKPHFSFPFSPLSLAKKSKRSTVRPILISPITYATNGSNGFSRPAANSEGGDNIARGSVGVSLAMACVLGIIGCNHIMKHPAHALQPIGSARAAESITTKVNGLIDQMDRGVVSSDIDKQLNRAFEENPEEAYEIQMELIRMLITRCESIHPSCSSQRLLCGANPESTMMHVFERGLYGEASRYSEDISKKEMYYSHHFMADHRFHLYKGIVYAMWNKSDALAKECFQKYIDILDASPKNGLKDYSQDQSNRIF